MEVIDGLIVYDGKIVVGTAEGYDPVEIAVPEGITEIGPDAFEDCKNLLKVKLPSTLVRTGSFCFPRTDTEVVSDEPIERLEIYGDGFIGLRTECPLRVKHLVIESDSSWIVRDAFRGWADLETVEIHGDVHHINGGAFAGCTNLRRVTFDVHCDYIMADAFDDCPCLEPVNYPADCQITPAKTDEEIRDHIRSLAIEFHVPAKLIDTTKSLLTQDQ